MKSRAPYTRRRCIKKALKIWEGYEGLLCGNLNALVGKVLDRTGVIGDTDEGGGELQAQLVGLVMDLGQTLARSSRFS